MQQSHHDEWVVIGTENCSLVAYKVSFGDSISPKWNQSTAFIQFFLSHPLCCENTVSFVVALNINTHIHTHTLPKCPHGEMWNEPLHLNPNHPQWDHWHVQWRNMGILGPLIPTAPWLISYLLRETHWANFTCLQATLCHIVPFISKEEELGGWQVWLCNSVSVSRDE